MILNSNQSKGYEGCSWNILCDDSEVLIPHALAVHPAFQRKGIGKIVVENILQVAKKEKKTTVRLDVLYAYKAAADLYTRCGFHFVEVKELYYDDTGWTACKLFERIL